MKKINLRSILCAVALALSAHGQDEVPLIKPVVSLASGLLLEPPVDLSSLTREEFLKVSATAGGEITARPWTKALPDLPPHPRPAVSGLTGAEVKACMLSVVELWKQGKAASIADVGLVSTQEDIIRRPMYNNVSGFSNAVAHVYLLVQKTPEAGGWGTFSIVQDRTTDPPLNYFASINDKEVKLEAVSCYKCHTNGPLAIHPAREDLVNDPALLAAFNQHIEDLPASQMHFPPHDPAPAYGPPLTLKVCAKCHSAEADRPALYKVHAHPIRVLTDFGYMPPNRALTPSETEELKAWLAPTNP